VSEGKDSKMFYIDIAVACDDNNCSHEESSPEKSITETRKHFKTKGWTFKYNDKGQEIQLCPNCSIDRRKRGI